MSELTLTHRVCESDNDILLVDVKGNVDSSTSGSLSSKLKELVNSGWNMVVLNLGGVDFISSAGWGAIIGSLKAAHEASGNLILLNMRGQVKRVFKMMGFRAILREFDTESEAVASLKHGQ